jgi:hypothetical protein
MSAHPIIAIIRLARATVHALAGNSCTRPYIAAFGEINACPYRRDNCASAGCSRPAWPCWQSGHPIPLDGSRRGELCDRHMFTPSHFTKRIG